MERDLSTASWLDEPASAPGNAADDARPPADAVLLAVARRICGQAERQLAVAERMRGRSGEQREIAELALAARRILRDGESVLVIGGGTPERRGPAPAGLGRLLTEVAAASDEPGRVDVPPAPSACLAAWVMPGAGQVLAELVAHALRIAPAEARIELVGRWAGDGGVTVEVQAEGVEVPWQEAAALENELAGGPDGPVPADRLGLHLAARLARRCGARVEIQTPVGGPSTPGLGTVGLVRFPHDLVEPAPSSSSGAFPPAAPGPEPAASTVQPTPVPRSASEPSVPAPAGVTDGPLFGPLDAPLHSSDDLAGTPIFAAVASAWFRTADDAAPDGSRGDELAGWSSVEDDAWRAAAARAAEAEELAQLPTTASGLPQRTPGRQMIPPPLASWAGGAVGTSSERAPERVRARLSTYQRGLEAGRHRAGDGSDSADGRGRVDPAGEEPGWDRPSREAVDALAGGPGRASRRVNGRRSNGTSVPRGGSGEEPASRGDSGGHPVATEADGRGGEEAGNGRRAAEESSASGRGDGGRRRSEENRPAEPWVERRDPWTGEGLWEDG